MIEQALLLSVVGVMIVFTVLALNYGMIRIISLFGDSEKSPVQAGQPAIAEQTSEGTDDPADQGADDSQISNEKSIETPLGAESSVSNLVEAEVAGVIAVALKQYETETIFSR